MPRVAKPKATPAGGALPAKKAGAAGKKNNKLYAMPEKINEGTVLTDLSKGQWRIGQSIGTGGFGEIYSASKVGEKNYDYVVKCEPHGNGPLFVEMHFYMRNARREDIEKFMRANGLKSLGMPYMMGSGSSDINGQKHRFIVMPRYGTDIAKLIKSNGNRLPEATAYRLAIQMLDVYQYVHSSGYVHADLKGANILLGLGKAGASQAYLVDYGLASHHTTKEFKPDPKKMHNGTIEYTSRDAHQGVETMRGDLEILGYNLIEWLGVQLPWVRDKLLVPPTKAQKEKEQFMADVGSELKKLFDKGVPAAISEYMKYVAKLAYNETPSYDKCRQIFLNALKQMKVAHSGDLDFKQTSTINNNNLKIPNNKTVATKKRSNLKQSTNSYSSDSDDDVICASDDDDSEVLFKKRRNVSPKKTSPSRKLKTIAAPVEDKTKVKKDSPVVNIKRITGRSPITPKSTSPRKRASTTPTSPSQSIKKPKTNSAAVSSSSSKSRDLRKSPRVTPAVKAKMNFSPAISLQTSRPGKTIINDNLTPNARSNKTYEFNFELDVSMDANVIVNVKRKKKATQRNESAHTPKRTATVNGNEAGDGNSDTPVTRVNVKKVPSAVEDGYSSSPSIPAVTLRKYRR